MSQNQDLVKELLWDAVVKAVLMKLLPFLGGFWLGLVFNVVSLFTDQIYQYLAIWVDLQRIFFKRAELESKFKEASLELKKVADASGGGSDAYKLARKAHQDAFAKFMSLRPLV